MRSAATRKRRACRSCSARALSAEADFAPSASTLARTSARYTAYRRKQPQTLVITRLLEIAAQEAMRQITPTMGYEIHEEKRHITHDVDPAQIGIEFDAVEWRPLLPPPHDVVRVQISVAFTHGPVPLAQRQQRPRFGEGATKPVIEPAEWRRYPRTARGTARAPPRYRRSGPGWRPRRPMGFPEQPPRHGDETRRS